MSVDLRDVATIILQGSLRDADFLTDEIANRNMDDVIIIHHFHEILLLLLRNRRNLVCVAQQLGESRDVPQFLADWLPVLRVNKDITGEQHFFFLMPCSVIASFSHIERYKNVLIESSFYLLFALLHDSMLFTG